MVPVGDALELVENGAGDEASGNDLETISIIGCLLTVFQLLFSCEGGIGAGEIIFFVKNF